MKKPFEVINTKLASVPVADNVKSENDFLAYHHLETFGLTLVYAIYTAVCQCCDHNSQYAVLVGKI
jgi:hypothetical protein